MKSRSRLRRNVFSLETLEDRNAPSHLGSMAHALVAVHVRPRVAHVSTLSDHEGAEKNHLIEVHRQSSGTPDSHSLRDDSTSPDKPSPDATTHDSSGSGSTSIDTNKEA